VGLDLADGAGERERLLADPAAPWNSGPGGVPEAERVRRERARETSAGIVAYSADTDCRTVVFALDGRLLVLRACDDPRAPADDQEPVPLENRIRAVTCGSFGISGGARVFVDQAAQNGFPEDPSAVEVGIGGG
jgi:dipeptidyl-peptidase-4